MFIRKALWIISLALLPVLAGATQTYEQVKAGYQSSDAELLDRNGVPIQRLRVDKTVRRMSWVSLDDMSPALINALIRAEDQRFYQHNGIDAEAMGKAVWDNLFRDRPRGASTITMQLASMLNQDLRPKAGSRNWSQKWGQIQDAKEIESAWSKQQILEAYLNLVVFRGELQGVGAAAQGLFNKQPSGLNEIESVILGSLIRSPNASSKVVAKRACYLARERKLLNPCSVIEIQTEVALAKKFHYREDQPALHVAQKLLLTPSEKVISTLDGSLQRFAGQSLRQQLMALSGRNVGDGALVVIDNDSGDVLAYVGNAGRSDVDGVVALRQAGSTLKPFLYELALEKKTLTAASILDDTPIDISTTSGLYIPQNYDREFKGYVSVRTSLASSLNVPAVRTLVMLGMDSFYNRLTATGISSLTESADFYGYSLALGSADVSLLELTNAYRVLANDGKKSAVHFVAHAKEDKQPVMDANATFIIQDILSDKAARSVTFGLSNDLATPYWTAVKTGTSKDMRDNWCIGFSEKYTVGVWVGNFDGQPMWDVSGVTGAAPVWRDVMDFLHSHTASRAPKPPGGVMIRQISYKPQLEAPRSEWFLKGTESSTIEMLADTKRISKIHYPDPGSIIALDPDIPEERQRIMFQAQGSKELYWHLDGTELGVANQDYAWRPIPGNHQLELKGKDGKAVDSVHFQVRGSSSAKNDEK